MIDFTGKLKKTINNVSRWDFYSLCIISFILVLQTINWKNFPMFLDCYYHLSVMRGFADAGGWVGVSFWEFAPFGRPHLYPPLYHLLGLSLLKAGLTPIVIARLSDFLIYPFFIFLNWRILRSLFSKELAFFNLLIVASFYPLYLSITNNAPFSIALLLGLAGFYFLQRNKILSASLCLALSFYTHGLVSWIMFGAIFIYSISNSGVRKNGLFACLSSALLAAPIFYHQLKYHFLLDPTHLAEFNFFSIYPVVYLLAFIGLVYSFLKKGPYLFFVSLAAVMSILFFTNRDRFFSGHALIAFSFLAAVALDVGYKRIRQERGSFLGRVFFIALFVLFYIAAPVVESSPQMSSHVFKLNSRVSEAFNRQGGIHADKARGFYHPELFDEIIRLVKDHTASDAVIYSNYSYLGGMISALTGRATSTSMLHEVLPFKHIDPIIQASLLVLFKEPDGSAPAELEHLKDRYRLEKLAETEIAVLYLNRQALGHKEVVTSKLPFWFCISVFFAFLAAIFAENKLIKKGLT